MRVPLFLWRSCPGIKLQGLYMLTDLQQILIHHEGKIPYAYQDSRGFWTIGIGRLIDKNKDGRLSDDEMLGLLNNDIDSCRTQLRGYEWYDRQDLVQKDALVEMCFNMGINGLQTFHKALAALESDDYVTAVKEFKDSDWMKEVHEDRVNNIMYRLQYNKYPQ